MTTATPTSTFEPIAALRDAWLKFVQLASSSTRAATGQKHLWASNAHPCARYHYLRSFHDLPGWEAEKLALFRRGKDREISLRSQLALMGKMCEPSFELVGVEEKFYLRDRKGRNAIVGKVDCRIRFDDRELPDSLREGLPVEIKNWSPWTVDRINKFEDVFENRFTKRAGLQLLSYLYGAGCEHGVLILDRQGLPKLLEARLTSENLERVEQFLTLAERVYDAIDQQAEPDFHDDLDECEHCELRGARCNPPRLSGDGAELVIDEALEADLKQAAALKPLSKQYSELWESIKKRLYGVDMAIVGDYLVRGKFSASSQYKFPDKETAHKYRVTKKDGRFTLQVTPIQASQEAETGQQAG